MSEDNHKPPRFLYILRFFIEKRKALLLESNFEEIYNRIYIQKGRFAAYIWFWYQLLFSLPSFIKRSLYWSCAMFKNYFKVAIRNIQRHKTYLFINISGLAVGIACSMLILFWIQNELSYDRFHKNAERMYRIACKGSLGNSTFDYTLTSAPLAQTLINHYPEVEGAVRILDIELIIPNTRVTYGDKSFSEQNILAVDSSFFNIFSFPVIEGDENTALKQPYSVVLTRSTAEKYFNTSSVLGKILSLGKYDLTVTGVIENIPQNSHFDFNFLVSLSSLGVERSKVWLSNDFVTYVLLQKGSNPDDLDAKFPEIVKNYAFKGRNYEEFVSEGNYWNYYLQPLLSIHLDSNLEHEFKVNGNRTYVHIFIIVAIVTILIACINFINLSTAISLNRAKEVCLRKVIGSERFQIIRQFLFESVMFSFFSLLLGILIVTILLPVFNSITGSTFTLKLLNNGYLLLGFICLSVIIGFSSGLYPAFIVSSFNPVSVLKGQTGIGRKNYLIRNLLIIFQFAISITLIIVVTIITRQVDFMQNENLGFEKEHVIVINNAQSLGDKIDEFKESMLQNPDILSAASSYSLPGQNFHGTSFFLVPKGEISLKLNLYYCDSDFAGTLDMKIDRGSFFSPKSGSDITSVVLNEEAVILLGLDNPIGRKLGFYWRQKPNEVTIVGVVNDFHYQTMREKIGPLAMVEFPTNRDAPRFISVRTNSADYGRTIETIKNIWDKFGSGITFDYSFLDKEYENIYQYEQYTNRVVFVFSIISIIMANLGLFGLVSYMAEQRRKEIGIRKVLGSRKTGIVGLLSKDLLKGVLIANIFSWPVAYYLSNSWLQNFSYRINVNWWVFILSGFLAFLIAFITISIQLFRFANANPVEALRYE